MHAFALDFTNILLTLELPWKDFPCGCICPVFCRTYVAQSVCGALLKHYKSTGSSQYSQDCHAHNITHSLVSDVMETAASLGIKALLSTLLVFYTCWVSISALCCPTVFSSCCSVLVRRVKRYVYREVSQFGLHFAITMAIAVKCQKRDFFGL